MAEQKIETPAQLFAIRDRFGDLVDAFPTMAEASDLVASFAHDGTTRLDGPFTVARYTLDRGASQEGA